MKYGALGLVEVVKFASSQLKHLNVDSKWTNKLVFTLSLPWLHMPCLVPWFYLVSFQGDLKGRRCNILGFVPVIMWPGFVELFPWSHSVMETISLFRP